MAGPWSTRRLLALGVLFLGAGLAVLAWELTQDTDIELVELPLLLLGAVFLFESYVTRRRKGLVFTDNPK